MFLPKDTYKGYFNSMLMLFANSQSMEERPPIYYYHDPLNLKDYIELPTNGAYDAVMADINGDGFDDLIIACQNNGAHMDIRL